MIPPPLPLPLFSPPAPHPHHHPGPVCGGDSARRLEGRPSAEGGGRAGEGWARRPGRKRTGPGGAAADMCRMSLKVSAAGSGRERRAGGRPAAAGPAPHRPPGAAAGPQGGVAAAPGGLAGAGRERPGLDGSCGLWSRSAVFARKAFSTSGCRCGEPGCGAQGRRGLPPG